MTTQTDLLNNRYKLLARVGAGGMASVYKGQDLMLQRIVAIKLLHENLTADPLLLKRFEREARAAANLSHPNIVTIHDVGQDGQRHYIVMEYVDGEDLKVLIRRAAPLAVEQAVDIAIQICAGVGHAHRAKLVHCDIKPQNVLITHEGVVKVTDFGIARALSGPATGLTQTDMVWGSPHYFAPEQATGGTPEPATDVYAIGIVLFELLTGRVPFEAENPTALALKHLNQLPPPVTQFNPRVPVELEHIINKVLAKEPSVRYRNAEQFQRILEGFRRQLQSVTPAPTYAPAPTAIRQPAATPPPAPARPPVPPPTPINNQPAAPTPRYSPPAPPIVEPQMTLPPYHTPPTPATRPSQSTPPPADESVDWTGVVLGLVALTAVLGLIPLWIIVFTRYTNAPPVRPNPTPFPTPIPALTFASAYAYAYLLPLLPFPPLQSMAKRITQWYNILRGGQ